MMKDRLDDNNIITKNEVSKKVRHPRKKLTYIEKTSFEITSLFIFGDERRKFDFEFKLYT